MKTTIFIFLAMAYFMTSHAQYQPNINQANGLKPGDTAPMFTALDAENKGFSLATALKTSPVVLIFYRGVWCPYCNKHLSQIQDSLQLIYDKGAQVVAISPEKPEFLEKMEEKTSAKFKLLHDENYKIALAYDVSFIPTSKEMFRYNTFVNAKIQEAHGRDQQQLPIPATYIIGKNGEIVWRHFDANYKKRSSVKDILNNLPIVK